MCIRDRGNDEQYALTIKIKPKSYIKEVQVLLNGYKDPLGLSDSLLTKPESYLDKEILQNDLTQLRGKLSQLGYINVTSEYQVETIKKDEVKVVFKANFLGTNNISQITYACSNSSIRGILKNNFHVYLKKPYVRDFIQQELSMLRKVLMEQGYYQLDLSLESKVSNEGVLLNFECKNERLIVLEFHDPEHYFDWSDLYSEARALVSRIDVQFVVKELTQFFEKKYEKIGRSAIVKIQETPFDEKLDNQKIRYKIEVQSEVRTKLKEILFRGNISFTSQQLLKLYYKHASDLALSGFVDENYIKQFIEILKKEYYRQGLLTCNAFYLIREEVKVSTNEESIVPQESYRATYPMKTLILDVNEGVRSFVTEFNLTGLDEMKNYEKIKNDIFGLSIGSYFNPIKFKLIIF